MNQEVKICSICGKHYIGFGNNAWPVNTGRCCNKCNYEVVIPERLYQQSRIQEKGKIKDEEIVNNN